MAFIEEEYFYIEETLEGTSGPDFYSLVSEGVGTNVIFGYGGDDNIGFLGLSPGAVDGGAGADTFGFSDIAPIDDPIDKITLLGNIEARDQIAISFTGAPGTIDPNASMLGASQAYGVGLVALGELDTDAVALAADVDGDAAWDYFIGLDRPDDGDYAADRVDSDMLATEVTPGTIAAYEMTLSVDFNGGGGAAPEPGGGETGGDDVGAAGAEWISGDDSAELVYGGGGADTIFGFGGDDEIYGNEGNDQIFGGDGDDWLFGGQNGGVPTPDVNGVMKHQDGTELIVGGAGSDLIYGNFGTDDIEGGQDNDTLFGGQGSDILDGGAGDDILWGNRDDDTMTGGAGADTFILTGGGGDRITDFEFGAGDQIAALGGFDQLDASDTGGGFELAWARGSQDGTVVFEGLSADDFSADWIGVI